MRRQQRGPPASLITRAVDWVFTMLRNAEFEILFVLFFVIAYLLFKDLVWWRPFHCVLSLPLVFFMNFFVVFLLSFGVLMLHSISLNLSHRADILFLFPFLMIMRERSFEMVKELFVGCGRPRGRSIIRFCLRKVKSGGTGSSDRVLLDATECRASSQFYIVLGESSELISC